MRTFASALIIDSDSISVKIVERTLRALGIVKIATALSWSAATSQVLFRPELVITEVVVAQEPCFSLLQTVSKLVDPPAVLAMSKTASRAQVFRLSSFGVSAFLEKPVSPSALSRAVASAAQLSSRGPLDTTSHAWSSGGLNAFVRHYGEAWHLTNAEIEILRYACAGMSRLEIAAERGVSINTVKTHLRAILNKAGVSSMRLIVQQLALQNLRFGGDATFGGAQAY